MRALITRGIFQPGCLTHLRLFSITSRCLSVLYRIEYILFPQNNYISGTHMYHHILYINIMIKVEMGKVEVQYLYNTFPTS